MHYTLLIAEPGTPRCKNSARLIQTLGLEHALIPAVFHSKSRHRFPASAERATRVRKGELGCSLAHIDCWRHVVKIGEPCIIFEDDIALTAPCDDSRRLIDETITKNPQSHFIFLGWCDKFLATHAYYVTPQGAASLLEDCDEERFIIPTPIDHHVRRLCQKNRLLYTHTPDLTNTAETEFNGVIKQRRPPRNSMGGRIRFVDVPE